MTDFFELEKKCKDLQRKKIIKYFIFVSIPIILLSTTLYFIKSSKPIEKKHPQKKINKQYSKPKIEPQKIAKKEKKQITKKITKKIVPIKEPILDIQIDFNKIQNIPSKKSSKKQTKIKNNQNIKHKKSILQEETISFAKAIKLAEIYYNNDDYKNSIKWCKLASKIDNNNEKVWKLYALNLEKTNQKEKAIKILKTYLKYKNSIELKYLLQRLSK